MKRIILFFLNFVFIITLNAQQTFTINAAGFTFNPSNVTVTQGDIVRFNVGESHPVLQVSQSTWNSNGNSALPGGFSFPSGIGDYTATATGTYYYVCVLHSSFGMKGTIVVNSATGIDDFDMKNEIEVFPNPARSYIIYLSKGNLSVDEIRILDITGRAVIILKEPEFSGEQVRISIENLNKGIYFIRVKSDMGIITRKFFKS